MESLLKQWPLDFTVLQANKVCSGALLFVLSFGGYPRYLECLWAQSLCAKVTETTQCFPFSVTSKVNPGRPWAFGKGSGHPRQWKVCATLLIFLSFCVSCVATWKEEVNSLILCVKMFPLKAARLLWKVNWKGNNFSSTIVPYLPGHKLPYFSRVQGIWARPLEISLYLTSFSAACDKFSWASGHGKWIGEHGNHFDGKRTWRIKDGENEKLKWEA